MKTAMMHWAFHAITLACAALSVPTTLTNNVATFPPVSGKYVLLMGTATDGDTIKAYHLVPVDIRLYGLNTPERGEPGYAEAKANLSQLVPPGVVCSCDLLKRDKYGRQLADIKLPNGGGTATQAQIAGGFGKPWDGNGPRP